MNRLHLTRALTMGAALALSGAVGFAQPAPDKAPKVLEIEPLETTQLVVRNVASNLMAYWLDPTHQPTPILIQVSQRNEGILFNLGIGIPPQPGNGNGPRGLTLPAGIQSLVSIDPQNVLWVRGTKKGIEALQKQVKEIDVPLNQVEFEVQLWEMSPNTLQSLPLVFRDTSKSANKFDTDFLSRIALAAPASDIAPTTQILMAGLKTNFTNLISTQRLTVVDGLVATTQSNESRVLLLDEKKSATPQAESKKKEQTSPIADADKGTFPEGVAFVNGQTGVTIAPTLHGDAMSLTFGIILEGNMTQVATTLRDGQTLAIRLPNANPRTDWPRVALITSRILRQ